MATEEEIRTHIEALCADKDWVKSFNSKLKRVKSGEHKGCLEWQGGLDKGGYGRFHVKKHHETGTGRNFFAHRMSYMINRGYITPDELILQMMKKKLSSDECINGYILDGFPRTLPQAEGLNILLNEIDSNLNKVIVIEVRDNIIIDRMGGRRIHKNSGRIYHIKFNPPKNEGFDDITNEPLSIRSDDKKETVKNRLNYNTPWLPSATHRPHG